ncbi:IclR family transcriptional regulator [Paramixta manurensis]|uniref:IclR family transcriptional regulator n=1 Tax=Paramixta manurensis TaxID=2740817 RepID=A0A6M8UDL3_9GAMM|nr:IclR family transcriptional regulator [Erwiniaceae bacterium PD-1]
MRIVPALDRGLKILSLIAASEKRLKVAEIAKQLGIPRSATYELIFTLAQHGAVQQFDNGEVALGHQVLIIGNAYNSRLDFEQCARSVAETVMQACNETVQVGILEERQVLYIAKADSTQRVRLVSSIGARLPAHCTALGKALLAWLPDAQWQHYLAAGPLEALTAHSITDPQQLDQQRRDIVAHGVAWERCESNPDVACVAAPVWNAAGENIAAMSISVPITRMSETRFTELQAVVIAGALQLSAQLGYRGLAQNNATMQVVSPT